MERDDLILISVDDHIIEPPDMFVNHLPERYRDDGTDVWQFRETVIPNAALNAVAGRPKEEYGLEPQGLDEIRPGCYDVHERVKDMNAGGILGSMCFPSFPGFAARLFDTKDAAFSKALVQAYNDWHIDEWCGAYFLTYFISDPLGVRLRHDIGIDNICWECDYPTATRCGPAPPRNSWPCSSASRCPTPRSTRGWLRELDPRSGARCAADGDIMAARSFGSADRDVPGVRRLDDPAGHSGLLRHSLRPRLAVLAPCISEAVRSAGGWLFDQVMAGWDVTVLTAAAVPGAGSEETEEFRSTARRRGLVLA
jgi:hypothetical protein